VKAETASDMVSQLKPEKILGEVKKGMAEVEILKAKLTTNEELYKKIIEELRTLRQKMAMFKGVDALIELNKETSENLNIMKKLEANIEKESSKVENTFVQFQRQFKDFTRFKDWSEGVEEEYKKMSKEFSALKIKADAKLIVKKDLDSLGEELHKKLDNMEKRVAGARELAIEDGAQNVAKKLGVLDTQLSKLSTTMEHLSSKHHPKTTRVANIPQDDLEDKPATDTFEEPDTLQPLKEPLNLNTSESQHDKYNELTALSDEVVEMADTGFINIAIARYNKLKSEYDAVVHTKRTFREKTELYNTVKRAFNALSSVVKTPAEEEPQQFVTTAQ